MKYNFMTQQISIAENRDCLEYMRGLADNFADLAIVDPPYNLGISNNPIRQMHVKKVWDNALPTNEYFQELFRVSKHQIIWGGNYFALPATQGFIIWDKKQPFDFSLAMCEFAWSSFTKPAKMFRYSVLNETRKMHPTQKPVALYKWLLKNYAKTGDVIFDSHLGSGSSRIAAYDLGFDFYSTELDRDYFEAQEKRFADHCLQPKLFEQPKEVTEQTKLF